MSRRFYINCPLPIGLVTLEGAEARHLASVCRYRPGDAVCLFNGDGNEYPATVIEAAPREVALRIDGILSPNRELPLRLEVTAPLPKGDRAQFLIEKLTELGVTSFVPLECARSAVHPGEAKIEKLRRYVIEASKQCGRNVLMQIEPPQPWTQLCMPRTENETRWLAQPGGEPAPRPPGRSSVVRVAVGPEGGFTDEEIDLGRQRGWSAVGLGPRVLRIETAALALACRAVYS